MLTVVNNPEFAGITEADKRKNNYLPAQIFHKPIWDEFLFYQASKWWLSFFIRDYAKKKDPIGANTWYWAEDGKWYKKQVIVSVVLNGDGTYTMTLDTAQQYFVETDVIDTGVKYPGYEGMNLLARVRGIGMNGVNQTITVEMIDPKGTFAASPTPVGDFADNEITLLYNTQGECFEIPKGRIHTPEKFHNALNKISDTYEVCDDASNQTIWFKTSKGRFYWVDEEEMMTAKLHKMKQDMAIFFGQTHSFAEVANPQYQGEGGLGVIPYMNFGSLVRSYAGALVEDDLMEMLTYLGMYSKFSTWHWIMGPYQWRDAMKAMKPYFVGGGVHYGSFGNESKKVGINYSEYAFGGRSLKLMEYQGFGDPDFLPSNPGSVDYKNFGMLLNLEGDACKLVYKKRRQGGEVKDWLSYLPGPTFNENGGMVSDRRACSTTNYTTHIGIEMKGLQSHGLLVGE